VTSWSDGLCLRVGVLFNLLPQGYPGDAREACCYRQFTQNFNFAGILTGSSRCRIRPYLSNRNPVWVCARCPLTRPLV